LDEKDPIRRAKILQEIEDNGKILEGKYRKKQELSSRFNFDPSRKVKSMLDAIKKALDKKDKKDGGNRPSRSPKDPNSSNNDDSSGDEESSDELNTDDEDSEGNSDNKKKKSPQN
jgi:hypothetical protein